jgi:hypothetical protein
MLLVIFLTVFFLFMKGKLVGIKSYKNLVFTAAIFQATSSFSHALC